MADFKEAFSLFDADADGFISTKEMITILRAVGKNPSPDDVVELVRLAVGGEGASKLRVTSDGGCDVEKRMEFLEFLTVVQSRPLVDSDVEEELKEAFRLLDHAGTGKITPADLKNFMVELGEEPTDDEVERMVVGTERKGGGGISYEEFRKLMMTR
jgi:Ca2+-binding EF-hand superfamily protein